MDSHICPICSKKISVKVLLEIKDLGKARILCSNCNHYLKPKTTLLVKKLWQSTLFIGIIVAVIPAKLMLRYYNNIGIALGGGLITAILVLILSTFFFYSKIKFEKV